MACILNYWQFKSLDTKVTHKAKKNDSQYYSYT